MRRCFRVVVLDELAGEQAIVAGGIVFVPRSKSHDIDQRHATRAIDAAWRMTGLALETGRGRFRF
jgi:hypothetical protein